LGRPLQRQPHGREAQPLNASGRVVSQACPKIVLGTLQPFGPLLGRWREIGGQGSAHQKLGSLEVASGDWIGLNCPVELVYGTEHRIE